MKERPSDSAIRSLNPNHRELLRSKAPGGVLRWVTTADPRIADHVPAPEIVVGLVPADQHVRTKESSVSATAWFPLATLARFGLRTRDRTAVRPALAACGEGFVSAIGSIIDETRAGLLPAALLLGLFAALRLTSP
jgi:hypothetical protein